MKRVISALLVCVLLVASVFAMASCGKMLSGTYEAEVNFLFTKYKVSYSFSGNEVEVSSVLSSALGTLTPKSVKGPYKITEDEDGELEITFDFGEEEAPEGAQDTGVALSFSEGEEDGVKYIKIAGVKYTKAD